MKVNTSVLMLIATCLCSAMTAIAGEPFMIKRLNQLPAYNKLFDLETFCKPQKITQTNYVNGNMETLSFACLYDMRNFAVVIDALGDLSATNDQPAGAVRLEIDMPASPSRGKPPPLRFLYQMRTRTAPDKPRAPNPAWWLYHLQRRFNYTEKTFEVDHEISHAFPRRLSGCNASFIPKEKGGWRLVFIIPFIDIYGYWPTLSTQRTDIWHMRITRVLPADPQSAHGPTSHDQESQKIVWPRGNPGNFELFCQHAPIGIINANYRNIVNTALETWRASDKEKHYNFITTAEPSFQRGNLQSDRLFLETCLNPLIEKNKNLENITKAENPNGTGAIKLTGEAHSVRKIIYQELYRLMIADRTIADARRDFLRDRLLGRPVKTQKNKQDKMPQKSPENIFAPPDKIISLDEIQF